MDIENSNFSADHEAVIEGLDENKNGEEECVCTYSR